MTGNMTVLQSFPHAGATYLRCYLEAITGILTGSDSDIEDSFDLAMMGMLGEDTVCESKKVWINSTHYPYMQPSARSRTYNAQKMICMVRNPLDVIALNAYFHILRGHDIAPEQSIDKEYPEFWEEFVIATAKNMNSVHTYITN